MKKLTAGIFTVLVSLVSANGANAAIATQGYVDQEVGKVQQSADTNAEAITEITKQGGTIDTKANAAQAAAEATAQGYVNALDLGSVGADGSYIKLVSQADGKLSATAEPFIDKKEGIVTGAKNAPSAGAVFDYVGEKISEVDGNAGAAMSAAETAQNTADAAQDAAEAAQETADGAVDVNTQQQTAIAKNASDLAEYKTTNDAAVKAADDKAVAAQGEVDALETVVANNKTAAETGIQEAKEAAAAANTAAGNALAEAKTYTDGLANGAVKTNTEAISAINNAENGILAQAKSYTNAEITALNLNELSRVPAECAEASKWCVLTSNGTNYYWEVIVRGTNDEQPTGDAIPPVK